MSAPPIHDLPPQDFRIDIVYDKPKSGMWHCGPNNCWVTVTHIPTMTQARAYHKHDRTARINAMDAVQFMIADCYEAKCSFPENVTTEATP